MQHTPCLYCSCIIWLLWQGRVLLLLLLLLFFGCICLLAQFMLCMVSICAWQLHKLCCEFLLLLVCAVMLL